MSFLDALDIDAIVESGLRLLLPRVDPVAIEIVADLLAAGVDLAEDLLGSAPDPEAIIDAVGDFLDQGLDAVPGWSTLPEGERDRVIDGVAILVRVIVDAVPVDRRKRRPWGRKTRMRSAIHQATQGDPTALLARLRGSVDLG